jgi:hypothetical protein
VAATANRTAGHCQMASVSECGKQEWLAGDQKACAAVGVADTARGWGIGRCRDAWGRARDEVAGRWGMATCGSGQ